MAIQNTNLGFTIKKDLESISIVNTSTNTISFEVYLKVSCNNFIKVVSETPVETSAYYKIPIVDGIYKVRVYSINSEIYIKDYKEYEFSNFNYLIDSIVADINQLICKCGCKDCGDNNCSENEDNIVKGKDIILSKLLSLFTLNNKYLLNYFLKSLQCNNCDIYSTLKEITTSSLICGKENFTELQSKIVGTLYYSLYLWYKNHTNCNPDDIDKKFKIHTILPCLEKINVNINCILDSVYNDPDLSLNNNELIEL